MRDRIKSEAYFLNLLEEYDARIKNFNDKLNAGEVKEDRVAPVLRKLFQLKFSICFARYSKGDDLNEIKHDFESALKDLQMVNGNHRYEDLLIILSMAILFDVNKSLLLEVRRIIDEDQVDDFLIRFLLNYIYPDVSQSQNVKFQKPYGFLKTILENPQGSEVFLKDYLEKIWYQQSSDTGWYDIHKSEHNLYSGYWSFESAAIVKILGLNDESLKECQYYPYDAAHFLDGLK